MAYLPQSYPGSTNIGETFCNNKISAITLTVGPGAPIRMEVAVMGAAGDHDTYPQVALTTDCALPLWLELRNRKQR